MGRVFRTRSVRAVRRLLQSGASAASRRSVSVCSSGDLPASAFASERWARRFTATQSRVPRIVIDHPQTRRKRDRRVRMIARISEPASSTRAQGGRRLRRKRAGNENGPERLMRTGRKDGNYSIRNGLILLESPVQSEMKRAMFRFGAWGRPPTRDRRPCDSARQPMGAAVCCIILFGRPSSICQNRYILCGSGAAQQVRRLASWGGPYSTLCQRVSNRNRLLAAKAPARRAPRTPAFASDAKDRPAVPRATHPRSWA